MGHSGVDCGAAVDAMRVSVKKIAPLAQAELRILRVGDSGCAQHFHRKCTVGGSERLRARIKCAFFFGAPLRCARLRRAELQAQQLPPRLKLRALIPAEAKARSFVHLRLRKGTYFCKLFVFLSSNSSLINAGSALALASSEKLGPITLLRENIKHIIMRRKRGLAERTCLDALDRFLAGEVEDRLQQLRAFLLAGLSHHEEHAGAVLDPAR